MKHLILWSTLLFLASLVWTGCKDMTSTYEEYVVVGGNKYPGKVLEPSAHAGYKRVEITWKRGFDPSVIYARIFWNNYTDSIQIPVSMELDSVSQIINGLPENTYTFFIRTYDNLGNRSIPVEVLGTVYGDEFQESLSNRAISSMSPLKMGALTINWTGAVDNGIFCDLSYTNLSGVQVVRTVPMTETASVLNDVSANVKYRTAFLPEESAIDTFYTAWSIIEPTTVASYFDLIIGGWNSNYGSCLDVDTGTPMSGSATEDPELRPFIDVFFDDGQLANIDLDAKYYGYNRLPDTGIRYAATSFTTEQFVNAKNDDLFKNLTATLPIISIKTGDIVFFIAKSGKKGLLRVVDMTDPQGDLTLEEKIQY